MTYNLALTPPCEADRKYLAGTLQVHCSHGQTGGSVKTNLIPQNALLPQAAQSPSEGVLAEY